MSPESDGITGSLGDELKGKKIILGITGSVSAFRSVDIARGLMRHGASVRAVMTPAAQKVVHPNLIEWATGNPVVVELSGRIEHVMFTVGSKKADLILLAPATANTIGKMAGGIDDTPVTSYVSSALGARIPILVAPAMHDTMWMHPIIEQNLDRLSRAGVTVIPPMVEEGKAKLASPEVIIEAVMEKLTPKPLAGKRVLITGGPTLEPIDPVRVITNRSSGKMAVALAKVARRLGATVTLVYGPGYAIPPKDVRVLRAGTAEEMAKNVVRELTNARHEIVIAAAAVSDYRPSAASGTKIPSSKVSRLNLRLERTPKIIERVKQLTPSAFLTIFKAEYDVSQREMIRTAVRRMKETGAELVVVNDVGRKDIGFASDENEVLLVDRRGSVRRLAKAPKDKIAAEILGVVAQKIRAR